MTNKKLSDTKSPLNRRRMKTLYLLRAIKIIDDDDDDDDDYDDDDDEDDDDDDCQFTSNTLFFINHTIKLEFFVLFMIEYMKCLKKLQMIN